MVPDSNRWHWSLRIANVLAILTIFTGASRGSDLDFVRNSDPLLDLKEETIHKVDPRIKPLWLEALARPEADLKRQVVEALLQAHSLGIPDWKETVPRLLQEFEAPNAQPPVRLVIARVLIALDARQSAPALMQYGQAEGFDAARLVEPALMRWQYAPMKPVWLARLKDAHSADGSLLLAIQAVAVTQQTEAVPFLRRLALEPLAKSSHRIEAARTLATLQSNGLESDARALLAASTPQRQLIDRLVAAMLLRQHKGAEAEALMFQLAGDGEPVIALVAANRLLEINPIKLKPLIPALVKSKDAGLRKVAVEALREYRTSESVAVLGPMLGDPHMEVRICARKALIQLAEVEALRELVHKTVTQVLDDEVPLSLEQAILIVGTLRFQAVSDRLLYLLKNKTPPIGIAAAWALRRLADPATAPAILKWLKKETEESTKSPPRGQEEAFRIYWSVTHVQMEHLIEAMGVLHYRPAAPLLLRYLPVPPPKKGTSYSAVEQDKLRQAAAWSLGHLVESKGAGLEALRKVVEIQGGSPEMIAMAAISLGRIKAEKAVPVLQSSYQEQKQPILVHCACAWALSQITGKPVPRRQTPREVLHQDWFLMPYDP